MKIITKTVWILSLVSLLTDMASEMLYPVMPLFLKQAGYTAIFIGVLEGFAEAVAGLSKSYFGKRSDITGKRLPFVQLGYTLSAISKPMLAIFIYPWWIFLSRTMDRLGKGIRTGARDAMLSDESIPQTKARVFGFHRSMDTMGAVLGPLSALVFLYFYPGDYTSLFLLAFAPGLLAIACTFLAREKARRGTNSTAKGRTDFFAFTSYWNQSPANYKKLVAGLLAFALVNSSDVFLLLKMKENGMSDTVTIALYIFYNLVYALLAWPIGMLADRIGIKKIFISGLLIFALVYAGMGFTNNLYISIGLFALYGIYAAATEGISKAWISIIIPGKETATAIGTYSGFQSIAALLASSICGFLWFQFGPMASFLASALIAVAVAAYIGFSSKDPAHLHNETID